MNRITMISIIVALSVIFLSLCIKWDMNKAQDASVGNLSDAVIVNEVLIINNAARNGEIKKIESLLDSNPRLVSARDDFMGQMPLHWAAENGNREFAEILLSRGADINARDTGSGGTPLQWAVMNGNMDVAVFLISKGANINAKNNDGKTALKIAMNLDKDKIAELLRNHGAEK